MSEPASRHIADAVARSSTAEAYQGECNNGWQTWTPQACLSRRPHPKHGRVLQAYLTETGEEVMSRAHEIVEAIEQRMLAGLDRYERLRLLNALRSCTGSLEARAGKAAGIQA
jgi:hypothetical protein